MRGIETFWSVRTAGYTAILAVTEDGRIPLVRQYPPGGRDARARAPERRDRARREPRGGCPPRAPRRDGLRGPRPRSPRPAARRLRTFRDAAVGVLRAERPASSTNVPSGDEELERALRSSRTSCRASIARRRVQPLGARRDGRPRPACRTARPVRVLVDRRARVHRRPPRRRAGRARRQLSASGRRVARRGPCARRRRDRSRRTCAMATPSAPRVETWTSQCTSRPCRAPATSTRSPDLVLDVNLRGVLNIADACATEGVRRLVFSSSSEVYGLPSVFPTPESEPLVVPDPTNPRWSYGGSKIAASSSSSTPRAGTDSSTSILRYHNVYGPAMGWDHVIPQFISRLARGEDVHGAGRRRASVVRSVTSTMPLHRRSSRSRPPRRRAGSSTSGTLARSIPSTTSSQLLARVTGREIRPQYVPFPQARDRSAAARRLARRARSSGSGRALRSRRVSAPRTSGTRHVSADTDRLASGP